MQWWTQAKCNQTGCGKLLTPAGVVLLKELFYFRFIYFLGEAYNLLCKGSPSDLRKL